MRADAYFKRKISCSLVATLEYFAESWIAAGSAYCTSTLACQQSGWHEEPGYWVRGASICKRAAGWVFWRYQAAADGTELVFRQRQAEVLLFSCMLICAARCTHCWRAAGVVWGFAVLS